MSETASTARPHKPFYKNLTVQVLFAISLGIILGHFAPETAVQFQPLGDGFVKLVKMVIGPVVFLTVVTGIASIGDMRKVGRVGGKALIYFELVTTLALVVGVIVVNVIKPGAGLNAHSAKNAQIDRFIDAAKHQSISDFLLNVIPDSVVGAFVKGDLLPILFFAVIFGAALVGMGERGKPIVTSLDRFAQAFFKVIGIVMYVAPLGAFGAMSFTIGRYGIASLASLGALMASVYTTMFLFVFVVLGIIARIYNFNIFKFVAFIRSELLIVLGTSSSESVLPRMITKMEEFGCSKTVTGLVLPTGYSFNLDGTSIYLSMAAIFIAQAFNIELTIWQELEILLVLLLTSKGAAAVTGGGFVTLAATLTATNVLPVEGLALLLGVDRFMSEARALTNLVGNGVATVVIAKIEGEFDEKQAVEAYQTYFEDPKISKI